MTDTTTPPHRATARVGVDGHRLLVQWQAPDPDLFRQITEDFKATFPRHGDRTFRTKDRRWSIPFRQLSRLEDWLACWFAPDGITRESIHTSTSTGRPHTAGHHEHSAKTPPPPGARPLPRPADRALSTAYATLHPRTTAPGPVVDAAYRALAALHHPDRGGDPRAMSRLNDAVTRIRAHRTRRP